VFGFLLLQFLDGLRSSSFKNFEFLFLKRPIVGNTRILLNLIFPTQPKLLRFLRFFSIVLFHLPYHLVLLLQRNPLTLTLCNQKVHNNNKKNKQLKSLHTIDIKEHGLGFLLLLFITILCSLPSQAKNR